MMLWRARIAVVVTTGAALLTADTAAATHNAPRDLSIHYSAKKQAFKGRIKSPVVDCVAGLVTLHRIRPGPNPIAGSATASGGVWSISAAGKGRYYAESGSFQAPNAFCPDVRSPVLRV